MIDLKALARTHDTELRVFRRGLFSGTDNSNRATSDGWPDGPPTLSRFGPVASATDRHAQLTVVGDVDDLAMITDDPAADGTVLTLSVAAHHRTLHSRLRVDADEAVAWIRVILGDEWAPHAYAAGALTTTAPSGVAAPRLTTVFFHVFIDAHGRPREPHPGISSPLVSLEAAGSSVKVSSSPDETVGDQTI